MALSYQKEPWKHPAARRHVVSETHDFAGGGWVNVITCECGWCASARVVRGDAHIVAQDDAMEAHWRAVIAEAESVPV